MKSYALLACFVVLAFVSSVRSDNGFHKFLAAVPEDVQIKCAAEADLTDEKAKILEDEMSVDLDKLSCYTACVLKQGGTMKDGNMLYDEMAKQMDMIFASDPNLQTRKDIIKECIEKVTGATDCEKVASVIKCAVMMAAQKGL